MPHDNHELSKREVSYTDTEKRRYRMYVYDNFDLLVGFFASNLDLTPSSFSGKLNDQRPDTSRSSWLEQNEKLKSLGITMPILWGKCYHAVRFFQYLGCWDNFEAYTIYKKIPHKLPGEFTTHWFLKDKTTNEVLDPTASQFDYLDITRYYQFGERAGGRLCYYGFTPKYNIWNKFVPPVTARKLGKKFKQEFGDAQGLEKWFAEELWWNANKQHIINHYKKHTKEPSNICTQ